jgi:hypothetical protein
MTAMQDIEHAIGENQRSRQFAQTLHEFFRGTDLIFERGAPVHHAPSEKLFEKMIVIQILIASLSPSALLPERR